MNKSPKLFPEFSLFILSFLFCFSFSASAQIGINTTDPKAMLDVQSDDSGVLIPRVNLNSTTTASPVVSPQISEMVYNVATAGTSPNNVTPGFYYWDGSGWVRLNVGAQVEDSNKWSLSGNAETTAGQDFLGTTDNQALHLKTNNNTRLIIPVENQVYASSLGSVDKPFYSFSADSDTGIYSPFENFLSTSTGGIERFRVGDEYIWSFLPHRFVNGTSDNPAISFDNSRVMGIYAAGENILGFSTNRTERMRINNGGVQVNSSFSLREGPVLDLQNGLNLVNPAPANTPFSLYRIAGPSAAFSIRAITPMTDSDGQIITLINTTNHPLTLMHNHSSSEAKTRIFCPTETNFVLHGKYSTVTLQYNKSLQKWMITDFADGRVAPVGNSITSVKGTTDTSMNSSNFLDMQGMSVTFTPKNSVVYVSFSASGYMDIYTEPMVRGGGAAFRLVNVTAGNRVEAGMATVATNYYNMGNYESSISAWNTSLNMFPINVTPGVSNTLKIQWARDAAEYPRTISCNSNSDKSGAHRVLTVFDFN